MSFDNRDSIDFGSTEIPKLFRSIFIPTLLGMLFNTAFTITDGIFVGNGIGANGLASVNLICPVMLVITGIGLLFGVGCSVVSAVHLSKDNTKAARINVTQAFIASGLISIVLCALFYLFPNFFFYILGVPNSLYDIASDYYYWFIPTCIFLMFQIVGEFVIRLDGSPKYAMFANIIPAVVNIILDYVFIFPCQMGLKGAALATDIGTAIGMIMTFYYMIFSSNKLRLYRLKNSITSRRLTLRNVGYMAKLGISAFVGEFSVSVMLLTGNVMFNRHVGENGVAAYSVICYLFPVVYMVYCAIAQSAQPIISYNYGASMSQRVNKTFKYSIFLSAIFGFIITIVFNFFSNDIVSIFLKKETDAFVLASDGLRIYSMGFVFMAFNVCAIGYFQSIEKSFISTILMLCRGVFLSVLAFVFLPKVFGTIGLWFAIPFAEFVTFVVGIVLLKVKHDNKN